LQCRAVTCTETKLTCIEQVLFSDMSFYNFQNNFFKDFALEDKRLIGRKFCGNLGSLPGFGKTTTFASFKGVGKCDSRIQ
jgi:hypothetical protein